MYRTIIAEDEGPARRRLEAMVNAHPALELVASLRSGQEAISQIPKLSPDLLLLDIQLKDKTAFEVLDLIQPMVDSKIIFITAYDKYAIKAFEIEAIDYLLKPYSDERFYQSLARAKEHVDMLSLESKLEELTQTVNVSIQPKKYRDYFTIKSRRKVEFLKTSEISHVVASGNYVEFVAGEHKKISRVS